LELKQNNITEAKSGYSLNFVGKDYAKLKYGLATETVLKPDTEHNSKPENKDSENVFITGDNLDALKHLQNAYSGKIKMIYIDPPYNTGKEFVYNDKFEFNDEQLRNALNYTEEEVYRLKSLQGKSSHSAWLSFMYPRLKIAQKLLSEDGVIFISIDDNEQANLRLLCDDVFGEGNFVGNIPILSNPRGRQSSEFFALSHEYLLVYSKQQSDLQINGETLTDEQKAEYKEKDERGNYRLLGLRLRGGRATAAESPTLHFPIYYNIKDNDFYFERKNKNDFEMIPKFEDGTLGTWRWSKQKIMSQKADLIVKPVKDRYDVFQKDYLTDTKTMKMKTLWYEKEINYDNSAKELTELGLGKIFDYSKPLYLIRKIINVCTNKNSIILDFFAGSGTTAHAVTQLNSEDGGNRKFIMVQLDEPTKEGSEARNAGYNSIDEIARERVKRAGAGFKHYRCQAPPAQTIDKIEKFDPSKEIQGDLFGEMANAFGEETILQTWLLSDGYEFSQIPETKNFAGYRAHYIDGSLYIINQGWGKEQTKELLNIVGKNELRLNHIRIYGYSLGMESLRELKINVSQSLSNVEIELRY